MKELIMIQLTLAFAMVIFPLMLSFEAETVLIIVGAITFLNGYINAMLYNKSNMKYKIVTKEEYDLSIKNGTADEAIN